MKNSRISANAMFFEVIYDIGLLLEAFKWNLLILWFMVLAILFLFQKDTVCWNLTPNGRFSAKST